MASVVYGRRIVKAGVNRGVDWCIANDGQDALKGYVRLPDGRFAQKEVTDTHNKYGAVPKSVIGGADGSYWIEIDGTSMGDVQGRCGVYTEFVSNAVRGHVGDPDD